MRSNKVQKRDCFRIHHEGVFPRLRSTSYQARWFWLPIRSSRCRTRSTCPQVPAESPPPKPLRGGPSSACSLFPEAIYGLDPSLHLSRFLLPVGIAQKLHVIRQAGRYVGTLSLQ